MKFYVVKGIDSFSKVSYWSTTGYWGLREHARICKLAEAERIVRESKLRNLYLDSNDRVEAEVEEVK